MQGKARKETARALKPSKRERRERKPQQTPPTQSHVFKTVTLVTQTILFSKHGNKAGKGKGC